MCDSACQSWGELCWLLQPCPGGVWWPKACRGPTVTTDPAIPVHHLLPLLLLSPQISSALAPSFHSIPISFFFPIIKAVQNKSQPLLLGQQLSIFCPTEMPCTRFCEVTYMFHFCDCLTQPFEYQSCAMEYVRAFCTTFNF